MTDKRIVGRETRQDKIKAALATKPTAAMLNNRGLPVEQLNRIVGGTPASEPPAIQRVIRNARRKPAMARNLDRRPAIMMRPTMDIKNEPAPLPETYLYPVPEWFSPTGRIDVSVIIPLYKSEGVVADQIRSWTDNPGLNVEIVYVDDSCPNDSKSYVLNNWIALGKNRPVGKIVVNEENVGYARSCNVGAANASGEYLVFLNSDTRVTDGWLSAMTDVYSIPDVGMVGNLQLKEGGEHHGLIDSAGSEWDWHSQHFMHIGRHIHRQQHLLRPFSMDNAPEDVMSVGEREMVTGCCFMMKKELFDELDGFDPRYRVGYWEDSDLCMRVKESGHKIMFTPKSVIWHKLSHSGAAGHIHYRNNQEIFRNKWIASGRMDSLLQSPRPGGAVQLRNLLVKRFGANGDVLMATAVLPALKKKYPGCSITFWTVCEQVLHGNPYIDRIVTTQAEVNDHTFDMLVNLDLAYEYHPTWSVLEAFAQEAGVAVEDCQASVATKPLPYGLPNSYIVMHAKREPGWGWVGRNWKGDGFAALASRLRGEGHKVVCVGSESDWLLPADLDLRGKTNIQELATVMKYAKFFVGMDSMPMHLAQIFSTPGVVFFGSVNPDLRLTGDKLHPITVKGLDCLGCHHRQKPPSIGTHQCSRGDSACEELDVDSFWAKVKEVMSGRALKVV